MKLKNALFFLTTSAVAVMALWTIANMSPALAQSDLPPTAPTGFKAEAVFEDGDHKVLFTWDVHPSDQGISGWQIKNWDPKTGDEIGIVRLYGRNHTFNALVDPTVNPGTSYTFTLQAINLQGPGGYSERVNVMTLGVRGDGDYLPYGRFAKPTGLKAQGFGFGVQLEWDVVENPFIVGYEIWRRPVDANASPSTESASRHIGQVYGSTENRYFNQEGLDPNTTYAYSVLAQTEAVSSPLSDEVVITMPARLPQLPDVVTGVAAWFTGGQIEIRWDSVRDRSVTEIFVERTVPGRDADGYTTPVTSDADPVSRVDSYQDTFNLEPNTTYFYTIRTKNSAGSGPRSEPVSVTTHARILPIPTVRPATPRNAKSETVFADGHHRVIVTWDRAKSLDQVTDWRIEKLNPRNGRQLDTFVVSNVYPTLRTYHDTDVEPSTTLSYTVTAVNPRGWSDVSRLVTVTTGREAEDTTTKPISIEEWFETRPPDTGGFAPTPATWLLVAIVGAAAVFAGFALRRVPMAISILRHKQRR